MKILVVNAGSSTYKAALYEFSNGNGGLALEPSWQGLLEYRPEELSELNDKVKQLVSPIKEIACIGHRVVHGGDRFMQPVAINGTVKQAILDLSPLAPLHNPANLKGIEMMEALFPGIPQVAVFDTAFHTTIEESLYTYPIPLHWRQWGVRVYGFHGISHGYCAQRIAELTGRGDLRVICCHLGNGSSLAAIQSGLSIDTTMGFTPLNGVIMGTRCGSIDPGIVLYVQREHHLDVQTVETALQYQSGLRGICGQSDFRELLLLRENEDPSAILAYKMLIHSLLKNIGSMLGSLGGLDVLIFTGGIGENAEHLRADVCNRLSFLGIQLDEGKNALAKEDDEITVAGSSTRVFVIKTREDYAIAQACIPFA